MTQSADTVSAVMAARKQGSRVEVLGDRTVNSQTFANPNGTLTYENYGAPRWVKHDGSWVSVDASLTRNSDGTYSPVAAEAGLRVSGGGTGALATITSGGESLSVSWPSKLPVPTVSGAVATYADVFAGVDLVVTADVSGAFSEVLEVKDAAAAADPGLADVALRLATSKGLVTSTGASGLVVKTAKGATVFTSPQPEAWDSSSAAGTAASARSSAAHAGVGAHKAGIGVSYAAGVEHLSLPKSLLTDKSAKFPMYLDPTYSAAASWEAYADVQSQYPTTNFSSATTVTPMGVGYDGASTDRLYWQAGLPSAIGGSTILSATLNATVYTATTSASTSDTLNLYSTSQLNSTTATWNAQPTQQAGPVATSFTTASTAPNLPISFNITSWIQSAANSYAWQWSGEVVNASESSSTHFVGVGNYPGYVITYDHAPYPSNGLTMTPATWASDGKYYTSSLTPTLNLTGVDPDGDQIQAQYQILSGTTVVASGSSGYVASAATASWADTTALTNGSTYSVQARFYDGTEYSSWATEQSFTVETDTPTAPVVSCAGYPSGAWTALLSGGTTCSWTETLAHMNGYIIELDGVYSWSTTGSTSINPGAGMHTLTITPQSAAGIDGPSATYYFGVGTSGAMLAPADQSQTSTTVSLQAAAPIGYTSATFKYRYGSTGSFIVIPSNVVADCGCPVTWPVATSAGPVGVQTATLTWSITRTLADDGPVQIEAVFTNASGGTDTTDPVTVTLDRLGTGADYGTTTAGPVTVGLQSGNAALTATDASIASYGASLSISRTFNSVAPSQASIFGPGWTSSLASSTAAAWNSIVDHSNYVLLSGGDGTTYSFTTGSTASGVTSYAGDGSATTSGLTLTKNTSANTFTLADSAGSVTTFAVNSGGSTVYTPTTITKPGASKSVGYVYDSTGKPLLIVAPDAASSLASTTACPSPASASTWTSVGCRGLKFSYDATTGNVSELDFVYVDSSGVFHSVAVADYTYDSIGKLVAEWDPRLTTPLKNTYTYDETSADADYGRITQISPAQVVSSGALAPWRLTYDDTSGDVNYGKVLTVSRTHNSTYGGGTATTTIAYSVPLTTASGGPVNMDSATAATWGQADVPTSAVAVWDPGHTPASTPTATDYEYATVHYYDANGREVNTANYVGSTWAVSTTEYDTYGNTTRELSPANRATALASASPLATAQSLDSRDLYACDNFGTIAACTSDTQKYQVLTDEYGPAHTANVDGTNETIRTHTAYVYDASAPNSDTNATGTPYMLTTSEAVSASVGGSVPATTTADVRTTQYVYANGSDTLGWTLGTPLKTVTDPSGLAIAKTSVFNESSSLYGGDNVLIHSYLPSTTAGGTAADTETVYFTAGTNSVDSARGNQPVWAGLVCKTEPAAQPGDSTTIPTTTYTYDTYLGLASKTDAYGSTGSRTTTYTHDAAERPLTTTTTVSGTGMGAALPETATVYSATTGAASDTETLNSSGAVTSDLATTYDDFGQQITYTDASGTTSTYAYDLAGRATSRNDGKGTDTITYTPGGQAASEIDSLAGTFTATYNADGALQTETYPDGTVGTYTIDSTGTSTALLYSNSHWSSSISDTVQLNAQGDWTGQSMLNASYAYAYDAVDRLSTVADTQAGSCTTRAYGYDANSNRTSQTTYAPASGGACQTSTGTAETYTYDTADRLASTTLNGTISTYAYDTQGDITTTPSADAGGSGNLAATYDANGLLASQTQSGTTYTWTTDATQSRYVTSTNSSTSITTTNHYTDGNDSPSWSSTSSTAWTRNAIGLDGQLAAQTTSTGATTLQLADLHGDVMAVVLPSSDTAPAATYTYTEFGGVETASSTPGQYGYLGGDERSAQALGGTILMGARQYSTANGRFDQTDSVVGGSANAYDYGNQNPQTQVDPTGRFAYVRTCGSSLHWWGLSAYCTFHVTRHQTQILAMDVSSMGIVLTTLIVDLGVCAKIGSVTAGIGGGLCLLILFGYEWWTIHEINTASHMGGCLTVTLNVAVTFWGGPTLYPSIGVEGASSRNCKA